MAERDRDPRPDLEGDDLDHHDCECEDCGECEDWDDDDEDDEDDRERDGFSLDPDNFLDHLVPRSVDWRGAVRRHPLVSVVAVGLVGYVVGRSKGSVILEGITAGASAALTRQLSDVFEGDFFDF